MRRGLIVALVLIATACASSKSSGPQVSVRLAPLENVDTFTYAGPISLRYAIAVDNPTDHEVTLRRLDLHTTAGGPYALDNRPVMVNVSIAAHSRTAFAVTAWGRANGNLFRGREPVTVVGKAYFDAKGAPSFLTLFQTNISPAN